MCKTILIIDDDAMMRTAISMPFHLKGCKVYEAASGREAMAILQNEAIEAVILDYELPDLTGLNVYKILQRHPRLKKIPVILISGHDKIEMIGQAYEAGIPLFIRKKDIVLKSMPDFIDTILLMKKYEDVDE